MMQLASLLPRAHRAHFYKPVTSIVLPRFMATTTSTVTLPRDSNQARGLAQFAIDFVREKKFGDNISPEIVKRIKLFHTDSFMCGISALSLQCNAPTILRKDAETYPDPKGANLFGSSTRVATEKAIVANSSAVREWDSNGTVFGYNPSLPGHQAGEFGHNDFYPVVIAAAQASGKIDGKAVIRGMVCVDEIRGRLAEVFSLKTYKVDHVVHGAIASAAVYGAMLGATASQIESAIGMTVAHYIPFRAIRAGKQLSDSKGASAALSTEVAIMSMKRAMMGFVGPQDIFRNPEAIFRWFEKQDDGHSPFNIVLTHSGSDFAVKGMHFKLGLYEHQSAGALESVLSLLAHNQDLLMGGADNIKQIRIKAYEPAFGIIGDESKRNPTTRQSADHSMIYIIATLLRKAFEFPEGFKGDKLDDAWCSFMLEPKDYGKEAIVNKQTREIMSKIGFEHGGASYDEKYPEGIPTSVVIETRDGQVYDSGLVLFPTGHSSNSSADLEKILNHKFSLLGKMSLIQEQVQPMVTRLMNIETMTPSDIANIYECDLLYKDPVD
eukprot:GHVN01056009.1.p1 GENE.GHVN01056009.1~~GHVN01056009.1.p1  ORF type:complete len:551 (-),score=87.73 GHVN01056009.1:2066-3718(-)